jgi:hypothetical protein
MDQLTTCNIKSRLKPFLLVLYIFLLVMIGSILIYALINFKTFLHPVDWQVMWRLPFFFILFPLLLLQIRYRATIICFGKDHVSLKRFWGMEKTVVYNLTDIKGFEIDTELTNGKLREYIVLKLGKRAIINISAFYHRNYDELKDYIFSNFKCISDDR